MLAVAVAIVGFISLLGAVVVRHLFVSIANDNYLTGYRDGYDNGYAAACGIDMDSEATQ